MKGDEKNSEENLEDIKSSIEIENIGRDQSTVILQQENQEPFSRDADGNIIIDAEIMEFFGEVLAQKLSEVMAEIILRFTQAERI